MKLSNLSLAILVAMGVAACGGSDDNNNQVTPPPGGNTPTPPPAVDTNKPEDPKRAAPDMTVEDKLKGDVKVAKTTQGTGGMRDLLKGYAPDGGIAALGADWRLNDGSLYAKGAAKFEEAVDPDHKQDPKRASSIVNYVKEGQLRTGASDTLNGAVLANPGFTYAKGVDGKYYRMKPVGKTWDEIEPGTMYEPIVGLDPAWIVAAVSQDKLVYIPNVKRTADGLADDATATGAKKLTAADLGLLAPITDKGAGKNVVDPSINSADFNVNHKEVVFHTAEFNGQSYDLEVNHAFVDIDLSTLKMPKAVDYIPVKVNYSVYDSKNTTGQGDDEFSRRTGEHGAMKAYNLPYSLAFVTVNQPGAEKKRVASGAASRNFFDFPVTKKNGDWGAYQVRGYQTPFLPENGRADYYGKSFGVDSVGDIHLRADFGYEGAHIGGSVANRTYADGTGKLPNITLANIELSNPGKHKTTGTEAFGNKAASGVANSLHQTEKWEVQLFGPNAEEAGGIIHGFGSDVIPGGGTEVFTTQREKLIDDSNIIDNKK